MEVVLTTIIVIDSTHLYTNVNIIHRYTTIYLHIPILILKTQLTKKCMNIRMGTCDYKFSKVKREKNLIFKSHVIINSNQIDHSVIRNQIVNHCYNILLDL